MITSSVLGSLFCTYVLLQVTDCGAVPREVSIGIMPKASQSPARPAAIDQAKSEFLRTPTSMLKRKAMREPLRTRNGERGPEDHEQCQNRKRKARGMPQPCSPPPRVIAVALELGPCSGHCT